MPVAEINGVRITYEDVGPKTGVPLVFVHGWTADMHRWDDQVKHFSATRRVIRFNLRGHGDSDKPEADYTINQLSNDLLALLNLLGVEKAILVGHSMGGMTVQRFVLDHPERVEKLVIVNSIARFVYSPGRKLLISLSRALPFKLFVRTNILRAFKKGFPRDSLNMYIKLSQKTPKHVVMSCYDAMCDFDIERDLSTIRAKTLVIHSKYDIQLPLAEARKLATGIPESVVRILDCGHESPLESPGEVTAAIDEFIRA